MRISRKLSIVGITAGLMTALQGCTVEDAARALLVILALMWGAGGVAGTEGGVPEAEAAIISRVNGVAMPGLSTEFVTAPVGANLAHIGCAATGGHRGFSESIVLGTAGELVIETNAGFLISSGEPFLFDLKLKNDSNDGYICDIVFL